MKSTLWTLLLLLVALIVTPASSRPVATDADKGIESIMDPHPVPRKGPWFEGWYNRWTDHKTGISIAVITTSYLEKGTRHKTGKDMRGYIAFAIQRPGSDKLEVYEQFPDDTKMISHGSRRLRRVDFREKTDFRWESQAYGFLTEGQIQLHLPGQVKFTATIQSQREAWSDISNNLGPGSFTSFIGAIPLHWYVFSLATESQYKLEMLEDNQIYQGTAILHQEKNWGKQFPKAWMWVQAVSDDNVQFVLAGGQANLLFGTREAFMGSFRKGRFVVNFNPLLIESFKKKISPQDGSFEFTVETEYHIIEMTSKAPLSTFSVLSIPTDKGYLPGAIESFRATTRVRVYEKPMFWHKDRNPQLIEEEIFENSALEFGANYIGDSFEL